ncbi:dihydrolipoamide acetyltransferase family protein [Streptomyces sp. L7]|uniref:dihydrolipoamide acetyltransferase family protein n=1 Tax=Streptomyces sp. L7 TaxID=3423954 RepID=UPI003D96A207
MGDFLMPALGADMEQGTLVEWLVKPGDAVHRGQLVAAVDTDKSVIDVETFEDGVVSELLAHVGDVLPVGAPLARITPTPASAGGPAPTTPVVTPSATTPAAAPVTTPVSPPVRRLAQRLGVDTGSLHGTGRGGTVTHKDVERAAGPAPARTPASGAPAVAAPSSEARAPARGRSSPRARKLAAERGLDLGAVTGSGPGGAVVEKDLVGAPAPAPAPVPSPTAATSTAKRTAGLRRAIGALMARSKKTIPHYYLSTTIDLRAAMAWMTDANAGRPASARLVPAILLMKATALAVRDVPEMNGYVVDGEFQPSTPIHLGVVVALRGGGVVAPAILAADTLALDDLMARLRDLVARARAGRLQRAEMTEATITVTNLGDLGVDSVFGVIYPPQVALVGFGRVAEQPWAHDGMVGARPAVVATLSADHRVSDGMRGARFLSRIDELLQRPEEL